MYLMILCVEGPHTIGGIVTSAYHIRLQVHVR